jgi:hypothetical protein
MTTSVLLAVLAAGIVAMPLVVVGESATEWWTDVVAGLALLALALVNVAYLARNDVEMMVWRTLPQAVIGLALAVSPIVARSSIPYAETTAAAGLVATALAVASGSLSLLVPTRGTIRHRPG